MVKKEVLTLAFESDTLNLVKNDLDREFKFNFNNYAFIALALLKLDKKLAQVREDLVPEQLEEEEFWRGYFFKIEEIKAQYGLPCLLGKKIEFKSNQN